MKIALVNNDDFSMYHFRAGLIRELVSRKFDVSVIVPPGQFVTRLESLGARCFPVVMNRFFSPLADIRFAYYLYNIFKTEKFDIVHNMTVKPNIYGTFAAHLAGVKHILGLVAGAGFIFMNDTSWKTVTVRLPTKLLLKLAMSLTQKVWFQNPDDLELFATKGIIKREKGIVIRGSGVNIEEYSPSCVTNDDLLCLRDEVGLPVSGRCVLMVSARMVWSKGVREFVEAARSLCKTHNGWFFLMICPHDKGTPDSVPHQYLTGKKSERLIIFNTFRHDIKTFMALADILVLPSYYPEGVPRSLLEGLAMGKPIITTDHQGCRETVEDKRNGFLIPVKDTQALIDKLQILMTDDELRARFGKFSRHKAEFEFDENLVVRRVISELYGF